MPRPRSTSLIVALVALVAVLLATVAGADVAAAAAKPVCRGADGLDPRLPCRPTSRPPVRNLYAGASRHPCRPLAGTPSACRFGAAPGSARRRIALLGDSHALHWLPALDAAARARHWSGVSMTSPGCFFSDAVHALPEGPRAQCTALYESSLRYLRRHREITTVLVSSSLRQAVAVPPGQTLDEVRARGFRRAYRALPRSVTRLIVIRDPPMNTPEQFACVQAAVKARQDANAACPLPSASALAPDPAVTAVRELHARRYRSVDLSDFFCTGADCRSVVAGVQVYRDGYGHMTDLYSSTLGTYLRRAVERVLGHS